MDEKKSMVVMTFHDVDQEQMEMVHDLFKNLQAFTRRSANFNVIDPLADDQVMRGVCWAGASPIASVEVTKYGEVTVTTDAGEYGRELWDDLLSGRIRSLTLEKDYIRHAEKDDDA